jgi:hypothetical protein
MNKTLSDYLLSANKVLEFFTTKSAIADNKLLHNKIITLQQDIQTIQTISRRIADISNICNRVLQFKIKDTNFVPEYIDPYPDKEAWANLEQKTYKKKSVTNGVDIPVKIVYDTSEIPNCPIYWISSSQQFAIRINGMLLSGNLGNICTNGIDSNLISKCKNGSKCKKLSTGKKCKYYHNNEEVLAHNLEPDILSWYLSQRRQFTNGSWMYNFNKKSASGRKISSANNLIIDLHMAKNTNYNSEVVRAQTLHDILLIACMNEFGIKN